MEKRIKYRGCVIITDNYLNYENSFFWAVERHGVEIENTLRTDDKMWTNHESAQESAKRYIDSILD